MYRIRRCFLILLILPCFSLFSQQSYYNDEVKSLSPWHFQLNQAILKLDSPSALIRKQGVIAIYQMRAFEASEYLIPLVEDADSDVRREAVMALGWCGNIKSLPALINSLSDTEWSIRQAAWIALENITAAFIEFDSFGDLSDRNVSIAAWNRYLSEYDADAELIRLKGELRLRKNLLTRKEQVVRAIGMQRLSGGSLAIISTIRVSIAASGIKQLKADMNQKDLYYSDSGDPNEPDRDHRYFVQAAIRTLGLLKNHESENYLILLLQNKWWAAYAAEALGDIASESSVSSLIKAYPKYCINRNRTLQFTSYIGSVSKYPSWDNPHLSGVDRIPRTAFMILYSLSKIDIQSPSLINKLQTIAPDILYSFPSDWDATTVYEQEPWQMISSWLLHQAGLHTFAVESALSRFGISTGKAKELSNEIDSRKMTKIKRKIRLDLNDWYFSNKSQNPPYAAIILSACSYDAKYIPALIKLLNHKEGWVRIHAAKALIFNQGVEAVPTLIQLLEEAPDDQSYGYDVDFTRFNHVLRGDGFDEYNDPSPRHKEAWLRSLGRLIALDSPIDNVQSIEKGIAILKKYLEDPRQCSDIRIAAAYALCDVNRVESNLIIQQAEATHPIKAVKIVAREQMHQFSIKPIAKTKRDRHSVQSNFPPSDFTIENFEEIIFIRGEHRAGNHYQISEDQSGYSTTDSGPTYRLGRNIWKINKNNPKQTLKQLTFFDSGYVADLELNYQGNRALFSYRKDKSDPWWHIYEMNCDGSDLQQLTFGSFHDVQPQYLPDGRIIFCSSRLGFRDEYHGYLCTALTVMNSDGSDIDVIGLNLGRDTEPVVGIDGRIIFSRLELFYSRLKTEWNLLSVFPDGTHSDTLYGPESREFWLDIQGANSISVPRHRLVRVTQPQVLNNNQFIINSFRGPMVIGPNPDQQRFVRSKNDYAVTTPFVLSPTTLLVAAGKRSSSIDYNGSVDHGLYYMDIDEGSLTKIFNSNDSAEFEARPVCSRVIPDSPPEDDRIARRDYSGQIFCNSIYNTRQKQVLDRGRFIRVIEGIPTVTRHQTHVRGGIAWRNHGGAVGRILGVVPVAPDGSFALELPADRLFHFQVLDANRQVLGNELIWQYIRPSEAKSCVGCHEDPVSAPVEQQRSFPLAHRETPIRCFPNGDDFQYRAKMWFKGWAPDQREERMRTVNSINRMGRD